MDINPATIFDVQKLGVDQISKFSANVTSVQKPLKKLYFLYKKNFTVNPPLPYLKIVAGLQGIAFSPNTQVPTSLAPSTLPQTEHYFPKDSIILKVALQFCVVVKGKKTKGAFVTLDPDDRIKQAKEYSELFDALDDKDLFLTKLDHPALFMCVTKSSTSKHLDAHTFVCTSDKQALDIIRVLRGESVVGTNDQKIINEYQGDVRPLPPSDWNSENVAETGAIPQPNGLQTQQPIHQLQHINMPSYGQPQYQTNPSGMMYPNGTYEQMQNLYVTNPPNHANQFYLPGPQYQLLGPNAYPPTFPMQPPIGNYFDPNMQSYGISPTVTNFYNSYNTNFPNVNRISPQPQNNLVPPTASNNDMSALTIPRPTISANISVTSETPASFTNVNLNTPMPNFQSQPTSNLQLSQTARFQPIQPQPIPNYPILTNLPMVQRVPSNQRPVSMVSSVSLSQKLDQPFTLPAFASSSPAAQTSDSYNAFQELSQLPTAQSTISNQRLSGIEQTSQIPSNPTEQVIQSKHLPGVPPKPLIKPPIIHPPNDTKSNLIQPKKFKGVQVLPPDIFRKISQSDENQAGTSPTLPNEDRNIAENGN